MTELNEIKLTPEVSLEVTQAVYDLIYSPRLQRLVTLPVVANDYTTLDAAELQQLIHANARNNRGGEYNNVAVINGVVCKELLLFWQKAKQELSEVLHAHPRAMAIIDEQISYFMPERLQSYINDYQHGILLLGVAPKNIFAQENVVGLSLVGLSLSGLMATFAYLQNIHPENQVSLLFCMAAAATGSLAAFVGAGGFALHNDAINVAVNKQPSCLSAISIRLFKPLVSSEAHKTATITETTQLLAHDKPRPDAGYGVGGP